MGLINEKLNATREEKCIRISWANKTYRDGNMFIKRSLRPEEWCESVFSGRKLIPLLGREQILNEAATLKYLRDNTMIPIPKFYASFEDDGVVYLMTEYVQGITMDKLTEEDQTFVTKEVKYHLQMLETLTSDTFGGPTGLVVPPPPFQVSERSEFKMRRSKTKDLIFSHGNLKSNRVIVNPANLEVMAITGWEFAGFYPRGFDTPRLEETGTATISGVRALKIKRDLFEEYLISDLHVTSDI